VTALKPAEVARFLARPDVPAGIFLVHGSDGGRIRETAQTLLDHFSAGDSSAVVTLDSGLVSPADIVAEALSPSLFGGRRVVRVRGAGKELAPVLADLVEAPGEAVIVLESGSLTPRDPLRALIEGARAARALPCYPDDARSLEALVREAFSTAGVNAAPDAITLLCDSLGNDREITRREIEKLVLYAGEGGRIERADVELLCADNAMSALDAVLDATATGHPTRLHIALGRLLETGSDSQRLLTVGLMHFANLRRWRSEVDTGKRVDDVVANLRPRPHFSRVDSLRQQLRLWSDFDLAQACARLQQATDDSRRRPALAREITERALLALCSEAARR
jgi:DNA polymerase-3 subunit delta